MPVEQRTESPGLFEVVQWTGDNLAEIAELTGLTPRVTSSVLTLDLGDEIALVQLGWWVRRDSDGFLMVASDRVASRWPKPTAPIA